MKRPPIKELRVSMSPDEFWNLKAKAAQSGMNVSQFIRSFVKEEKREERREKYRLF